MTETRREFWQSSVILVATLAAGLLIAWLIIKLQKPDPPADPWWAPKAAQQEQSA